MHLEQDAIMSDRLLLQTLISTIKAAKRCRPVAGTSCVEPCPRRSGQTTQRSQPRRQGHTERIARNGILGLSRRQHRLCLTVAERNDRTIVAIEHDREWRRLGYYQITSRIVEQPGPQASGCPVGIGNIEGDLAVANCLDQVV